MESKLDSVFMLACRLLKWTKTVPVNSKSHFPIQGGKKKSIIIKNLSALICNMLCKVTPL